MSDLYDMVIIGSGHAGLTLAKQIRLQSKSASIAIITADDDEVYAKPMLSNAFNKKLDRKKLVQQKLSDWSQKSKVDVFLQCSVVDIDCDNRILTTVEKKFLYRNLIFCVGAITRYPETLDSVTPGVTWRGLNTLDDYVELTRSLKKPSQVTILGAGLIGCELANDLALSGHKVAVISSDTRPLQRYLPKALSQALLDSLNAIGVQWFLDQEIEGANGNCIVTNSSELPVSDVFVAATGLSPRVALASKIGLRTNIGIVCNNYMQTSKPGIYALGDCAEQNGKLHMYIDAINISARALAKTLTGNPTEVKVPPIPVI